MANSVYIRVNTGWDQLVELNQRPKYSKQVEFRDSVDDGTGNPIWFDDMPNDSKYYPRDYYGCADSSEVNDTSNITCRYRLERALANEKLICFETNNDSMKTTKLYNGGFVVTIKNITIGAYANYYYSKSNRGLGFISNIKSYTYYNNAYKKELIQVGCPKTGLATVNMPAFVDGNLTCHNFYSEYEADTGKFVRSVMHMIQEGSSVDLTNRQFCIRTKRDFYTPVVFSYVRHEDNPGGQTGGSNRDVMNDHYYSSDTPLFTLEDSQAPESETILFYLFDPDGLYNAYIDKSAYTGGTN